eukprot:285794-Pelagomonas_calceolata.AAC.8
MEGKKDMRTSTRHEQGRPSSLFDRKAQKNWALLRTCTNAEEGALSAGVPMQLQSRTSSLRWEEMHLQHSCRHPCKADIHPDKHQSTKESLKRQTSTHVANLNPPLGIHQDVGALEVLYSEICKWIQEVCGLKTL